MRSFATRQAHRATSKALRDALSVCRAAGFDLIVLDIWLPQLDGLATLARLRERGVESQVVIISGPSEENTQIYAVANRVIPRLKAGTKGDPMKGIEETGDYWIDEKSSAAMLTDAGVFKVQKLLGVENLYDPQMLQVRADVRLEDVPRVQSGQSVRIETASARGPIDGEVLSAPNINEPILGGNAQITGSN